MPYSFLGYCEPAPLNISLEAGVAISSIYTNSISMIYTIRYALYPFCIVFI